MHHRRIPSHQKRIAVAQKVAFAVKRGRAPGNVDQLLPGCRRFGFAVFIHRADFFENFLVVDQTVVVQLAGDAPDLAVDGDALDGGREVVLRDVSDNFRRRRIEHAGIDQLHAPQRVDVVDIRRCAGEM